MNRLAMKLLAWAFRTGAKLIVDHPDAASYICEEAAGFFDGVISDTEMRERDAERNRR